MCAAVVVVGGMLGCGSAHPQPVPTSEAPREADATLGEDTGLAASAEVESGATDALGADEVGPEVSEVVAPDPRQAFATACGPAAADPAECLAAAATLSELPELTAEERAQVEAATTRARAWNQVDAHAVGVLLPLSGDFARLGKQARAAIELAFEGAPARLIVRDTGGDPATAKAAAEALVLEEHVAVVLGPIGRKETAAALEVLRAYRVPTLPLATVTPPAANAQAGVEDVAKATRAGPEDLTAALAKHARTELGAARMAILRPDTEGGQELATAMTTAFERLGGTVARVVAYDTHTKDLHDVVRQLVGAPEGAKKPNKATPKPDFDALFIPEQALVVRRIAPFLPFWGITPRTRPGGKGVQLLGASGWNQVSTIDHAEHLTENAVFADALDPALSDPTAADFARRFTAKTQLKPTALEGETFDAAGLARDALMGLAGSDHALRKVLLARLGLARMRPGATGFIVVVAGKVLPRVVLLTVDGDAIRVRHHESEEKDLRANAAPPTPEHR